MQAFWEQAGKLLVSKLKHSIQDTIGKCLHILD